MLAFKELLTFQFDGSSALNVYAQNFNEMVKDIDESIRQNLSA
jgi:hypothetical protein